MGYATIQQTIYQLKNKPQILYWPGTWRQGDGPSGGVYTLSEAFSAVGVDNTSSTAM